MSVCECISVVWNWAKSTYTSELTCSALEDMVIFQFSEKGPQLECMKSVKNQDNFINRVKRIIVNQERPTKV